MSNSLILLATQRFEDLHHSVQREIYREFYQFVYGMIFYIIKDHAITEDIIQEAFLTSIRKPPVLKDEAKLLAWIKTVTRNHTFNYLRKNKNDRNIMDVDCVFIDENIQPSHEPLESEVTAKIMEERIKAYLDQIKPEHKLLIELRWKKEMSYKEMASELGTTENVIRQKLYRAREAIRKKMMKEWGVRE